MGMRRKVYEGTCINHKGGVGEIGSMINHSVFQKGTVGDTLINHDLKDGAPTSDSVLQFDCTDEDLARMLGLYSYIIRALVVGGKRSIFQILEELKEALFWQMDHFNRIGIEYPEEVVIDGCDFSLASHPDLKDVKLSTFFFGPEAQKVRPDQKRFDAVQFFNNKNNVIRLAKSLGVRVPPTLLFSSVDEVGDCADFVYPSTIKMGNSVSGLGLEKCYSREHLEKVLRRVPVGKDFQMQKFLENLVPFSIQWWADESGPVPITGTCNFIEGNANHAGNWSSPDIPHRALIKFTLLLAVIAWMMGIRDWFSFDVGLYDNGSPNFYLLECNPRYTGAAYPFIAASKLLGGIKEAREYFWASKTYKSSMNSINKLDLGELEFGFKGNPKSGKREGWISVNPGPLSVGDGKISMMYVGNPANYRKSEDKLKNLLDS
ncbi:MAG: hypothetical protein PHH24_01210 [Candidatus Moranbacteria bacterium]|nr:hypothetical protein [Candidatus Moranbacteria bacterium]